MRNAIRTAQRGPKLFTCPKCRHTYLGHDPVPDCPRCGYDYRGKAGFRWDIIAYLLVIMGLVSFLLVSSYYKDRLNIAPQRPIASPGKEKEKLPGSSASKAPFESPYRERGP
jgi:hypothetical protein